MQIYLINLDRQPLRLQRMEALLQGLPYRRIAAVDGRAVAGPERRDNSRPQSCENLSRYERACTLSHRAAWQEFLAGQERYACILEDDIFLSADFFRFIKDESWIPEDCVRMKIETYQQKVFVTRAHTKCLNRMASVLLSLHFGTAAYIVSRPGAAALLERTTVLDRTCDRLIFDEDAIRNHHPIYQLIPALCIQAQHIRAEFAFEEMQSSIQPKPLKLPKTLRQRIRLEVCRPFRQLHAAAGQIIFQCRANARRMAVPYA